MLRLTLLLSLCTCSMAFAQACEETDPELESAESELWAVYQLAYGPAGGDMKERLDRAQRSWLDYRDANCDVMGERWGEVAPEPRAACVLSMTRDRTFELRLIAQTAAKPCGCGQIR